MTGDFALRATTELDVELLWTIQRVALGAYVSETFGSDEPTQRRYFDEHFDRTKHQIIVVDGRDVGYLFFEPRDDHVYLGNLALLPEFQRRGIGAAVLRHVIEQADRAGLPIRLQVLHSNPAKRFYERHGFSQYDDTDFHFQMIRPASG